MSATPHTAALQRIEHKLLQGGAALPVKQDANGVEHGLSIALLLVREEIEALQQPAAEPDAIRQALTALEHARDYIGTAEPTPAVLGDVLAAIDALQQPAAASEPIAAHACTASAVVDHGAAASGAAPVAWEVHNLVLDERRVTFDRREAESLAQRQFEGRPTFSVRPLAYVDGAAPGTGIRGA